MTSKEFLRRHQNHTYGLGSDMILNYYPGGKECVAKECVVDVITDGLLKQIWISDYSENKKELTEFIKQHSLFYRGYNAGIKNKKIKRKR